MPELVGTWKCSLGVYTLNKDGSYAMNYDYNVANGPGQPLKRMLGVDKGSWASQNDVISFKSGSGAVIRNTYQLKGKGSELDLFRSHVKQPQVLTKVSAPPQVAHGG